MTTLSLGWRTGSVVRGNRALGFEQPEQLFGLGPHERNRTASLDIQAYQRFGIRGAQVEAPFRKLERHAVGAIEGDGLRRVALLERGDGRLGVGDAVVQLAADRKP